jgi:PHD/YefM family antitoxin component YafN of YafNO toxin-antitoxin module
MTATTVTVSDFRNHMSDVIDDVVDNSRVYHLVRHGQTEAGMVSKELLDELEDYLTITNPKIAQSLKLAQADVAAGRVHSAAEVRAKLGL